LPEEVVVVVVVMVVVVEAGAGRERPAARQTKGKRNRGPDREGMKPR